MQCFSQMALQQSRLWGFRSAFVPASFDVLARADLQVETGLVQSDVLNLFCGSVAPSQPPLHPDARPDPASQSLAAHAIVGYCGPFEA